MYADYTFYTESFFGSKIPEEKFSYYAARASDFLAATYGTDQVGEENLAKACCACAEVYYSDAESSENISSEKVGDYSVTYAAKSSQTSRLEDQLLEAAGIYMNTVGWC